MDKQTELIKQLQELNTFMGVMFIIFGLIFLFLFIILINKFFNHKIKCPNCNEGELFLVRSEREEEQLTYQCNNPNCSSNRQNE